MLTITKVVVKHLLIVQPGLPKKPEQVAGPLQPRCRSDQGGKLTTLKTPKTPFFESSRKQLLTIRNSLLHPLAALAQQENGPKYQDQWLGSHHCALGLVPIIIIRI